MLHIDPSKLVIAVSTHLRPVPLRVTVKLWRESCPDYRQMYVVVSHPEGAVRFEPPERCQVIHTGRVPQHPGCMSKTWNLAMQWAFQDPDVEWLLCSMDDVGVRSGWLDLVNRHAFQLYLAPCGERERDLRPHCCPNAPIITLEIQSDAHLPIRSPAGRNYSNRLRPRRARQ